MQTAMENANDHFAKSMEIAHQKALKEQAEKEAREEAKRKEAEQIVGTGPELGDSVRTAFTEFSFLWEGASEQGVLMRSLAYCTTFVAMCTFRVLCGPFWIVVGNVPEWRRRETGQLFGNFVGSITC